MIDVRNTFTVLCSNTVSGTPNALLNAQFGEGSGPIFLDEVGCSGRELDLLSCGRGTALGRHRCDHSQDAGIHCAGIVIATTRNQVKFIPMKPVHFRL